MSTHIPGGDHQLSGVERLVLEDAPCVLGCDEGDEALFAARDILYGCPGEFSVVRCRGCGLIRTNPRPSQASMSQFYPVEYGPFEGTRVKGSIRTPTWARDYLRRRFGSRSDLLPPIKTGHMLEVGCASGRSLLEHAHRGWVVEGIEPDPRAAAQARALGFPVQTATLETAVGPAEPSDLVVAWMVLEHLHEPVASLAKLASWTRPGGWLAASVPNAAALEFTLFKSGWYALQVPTHLYHYTPATIARVLDAGGWRLERVWHQRSAANLIMSTGHALERNGFRSASASYLANFSHRAGRAAQLGGIALGWFLAGLGQSGRMTVWATRKP